MSNPKNQLLNLILFVITGVAGLLVGHPFDTVKVHMQTQNFHNPKYTSTFDCIKKLVRSDSIGGLYRGISSPLVGVGFINAIVFGVYGNIQRYSSDPNSIKMHFFAGSAAGLVQSLICSPMELAKTRLQLQNSNSCGQFYNGPIDCLRYVAKTDGVRGIFKGLGITALRDVPGFSSYFVSYELMMRLKENAGVFYTLMAGGLAGVVSWVIVIPIDVIKSRLQADGMNHGVKKYHGIGDCWRKSFNQEGWSFLTRGLGSTLIRAFPMNAVCFLVVSTILKNFGDENANFQTPEFITRFTVASIFQNESLRRHGILANDSFERERSIIYKLDSTFDLSTFEKNVYLLCY